MQSRSASRSAASTRWPPPGAPFCGGNRRQRRPRRALNRPVDTPFRVEFVFGATSPVAFSSTSTAGTVVRRVSVSKDLAGGRSIRPRPLGADVAYTAEQIQVLEGLEPVRRRPGMYIGSTDKNGLHHLVWELVDNSVDEALAGYCDEILVTMHADGSISVRDDGRGIPVDKMDDGRSALEVVLTVLHAGGKFGGGGYKVSGGLHGVGLSVVNALSERLEARVHRDGREYHQSYVRGVPQSPVQTVGKSSYRGTIIRFWPDGQMFPETGFDRDLIMHRLREMAFLNKGLKIILDDERLGFSYTFYFEGG